MKYVHDAFDNIRKRVMKRFEENKKSDEYYLLKYRDKLLFQKDPLFAEHRKVKRNRHFHYDLSEAELLEMTLKIDKQLNEGYELYREYVRFNDSFYDDHLEAINDLSEIINDFRISVIREFEKLANTLDNWKSEIANGYTNFKRFRNSVM